MRLPSTAATLYERYAGTQPIIDYHNHLSAQELYENKNYRNITQFWLAHDHYKWRAMRQMGIEERLITGDAPDEEKFLAWSQTVERLVGSPLFDWTAMELSLLFGIEDALNAQSAAGIYVKVNAALQDPKMRPMQMLGRLGVRVVCTTNEPSDNLEWHGKLAEQKNAVTVLPSFRPDKILFIHQPEWLQEIEKLGASEGISIRNLDDLKRALAHAFGRFRQAGCVVADHGFEHFIFAEPDEVKAEAVFIEALGGNRPNAEQSALFWSTLLYELAGLYSGSDTVMLLRTGVLRNSNRKLRRILGNDAGGDCIGQSADSRSFARVLDNFNNGGRLPKTILFSLHPGDAAMLATLAAGFSKPGVKGFVQLGAPWWFNDTAQGICRHLDLLMEQGSLAAFVGMLTDSRSVGSFVRHAFFRRILCARVGALTDGGEYPDLEKAGEVISDICYHNAARFFNFNQEVWHEFTHTN